MHPMRRAVSAGVIAVLFAGVGTTRAEAQRSPESTAIRPNPGRPGGRRGGPPPEDRGQLALTKEVRQRFAQVVRRELKLTDDQSKRLEQTDARFQEQRGAILRDER